MEVNVLHPFGGERARPQGEKINCILSIGVALVSMPVKSLFCRLVQLLGLSCILY